MKRFYAAFFLCLADRTLSESNSFALSRSAFRESLKLFPARLM